MTSRPWSRPSLPSCPRVRGSWSWRASVGGVATDDYEALLAGGSGEPRHPQVDENATAELFYTSGTTGLPKGVALSHRALYLHALHAQVALGFGEDDVVLHVVPMFHVNGWGVPHFVTLIGGRHVMLRRFDPVALMQHVERHRVTRLLGVPAIFNAVLHTTNGRRSTSRACAS